MKNFEGLKFLKADQFKDAELMCPKFLNKLDSLCEYLGANCEIVYPTNGVCAKDSSRWKEKGADVAFPNYRGSLFSLYLIIERFGFSTIGLYPDYESNGRRMGRIHLDVRELEGHQGSRWIGKKNKEGNYGLHPLNPAALINGRIITVKKSTTRNQKDDESKNDTRD